MPGAQIMLMAPEGKHLSDANEFGADKNTFKLVRDVGELRELVKGRDWSNTDIVSCANVLVNW